MHDEDLIELKNSIQNFMLDSNISQRLDKAMQRSEGKNGELDRNELCFQIRLYLQCQMISSLAETSIIDSFIFQQDNEHCLLGSDAQNVVESRIFANYVYTHSRKSAKINKVSKSNIETFISNILTQVVYLIATKISNSGSRKIKFSGKSVEDYFSLKLIFHWLHAAISQNLDEMVSEGKRLRKTAVLDQETCRKKISDITNSVRHLIDSQSILPKNDIELLNFSQNALSRIKSDASPYCMAAVNRDANLNGRLQTSTVKSLVIQLIMRELTADMADKDVSSFIDFFAGESYHDDKTLGSMIDPEFKCFTDGKLLFHLYAEFAKTTPIRVDESDESNQEIVRFLLSGFDKVFQVFDGDYLELDEYVSIDKAMHLLTKTYDFKKTAEVINNAICLGIETNTLSSSVEFTIVDLLLGDEPSQVDSRSLNVSRELRQHRILPLNDELNQNIYNKRKRYTVNKMSDLSQYKTYLSTGLTQGKVKARITKNLIEDSKLWKSGIINKFFMEGVLNCYIAERTVGYLVENSEELFGVSSEKFVNGIIEQERDRLKSLNSKVTLKRDLLFAATVKAYSGNRRAVVFPALVDAVVALENASLIDEDSEVIRLFLSHISKKYFLRGNLLKYSVIDEYDEFLNLEKFIEFMVEKKMKEAGIWIRLGRNMPTGTALEGQILQSSIRLKTDFAEYIKDAIQNNTYAAVDLKNTVEDFSEKHDTISNSNQQNEGVQVAETTEKNTGSAVEIVDRLNVVRVSSESAIDRIGKLNEIIDSINGKEITLNSYSEHARECENIEQQLAVFVQEIAPLHNSLGAIEKDYGEMKEQSKAWNKRDKDTLKAIEKAEQKGYKRQLQELSQLKNISESMTQQMGENLNVVKGNMKIIKGLQHDVNMVKLKLLTAIVACNRFVNNSSGINESNVQHTVNILAQANKRISEYGLDSLEPVKAKELTA